MCKWGECEEVEVTIAPNLSCTGRGKRKIIKVDKCIADIVRALDNYRIKMRASCCGHHKAKGQIVLDDGRYLFIAKCIQLPDEYWNLENIEKLSEG